MTTLQKAPTGIEGLDDITHGGLPENRPTLVCGYAGCGKTVLGMQFILNGAIVYNEPGVFISMEESEDDLRKNLTSFGYNIKSLEEDKKVYLENININRDELFSSGQFDLSALFIRIEQAINRVQAKRMVIDTFELIFNNINDENVFRRELVRLVNWLKSKNVTTIFTSESIKGRLTKLGIEEFITDCVITLKQTLTDNIYTRRLHVLKYRGSSHGTNEYPFIISAKGISFLPITNPSMPVSVSSNVLSTGIKELDEKIEKKGFYEGSTTLLSGTAGVGKTSLAVASCIAAMKDNKKAIIFSFEEAVPQLKRNMNSIGYEMEQFEKTGLLKILATRPSFQGMEMHLMEIQEIVENFKPAIVAFDPINALVQAGTVIELRNLLLRLIDHLRNMHISTVFTSLTSKREIQKELGISSMVDNWIQLEDIELNNEINHSIYIVKARGMAYNRGKFLLDFSANGLSIKELP